MASWADDPPEALVERQVDKLEHLRAELGVEALETDWDFEPCEGYFYGPRHYYPPEEDC